MAKHGDQAAASCAGEGGHKDRLLHPTAWGTGLSVLGPALLGLVTELHGAVGGDEGQGLAVPWRCRAV